jgi:sulfotransferase
MRIIACIDDPDVIEKIYGSVEARHQETIFLDFPDHLANLSRYARADKLFAAEGVIGGPLKSIESIQDVNEQLQKHLYYVVFEHLVQDPVNTMSGIYQWLQLPLAEFDPQALPAKPHESDSYYRFKYPHRTRNAIHPPGRYTNPPRIELELKRNFSWFYKIFYPGISLP